MRRLFLFVMTVMSMALLSAGAYPPAKPTISVDQSAAAAGDPILVSVSGFLPGEVVRITPCSGESVDIAVDASGNASVTISAPAAVGTCVVEAVGLTSGRSASTSVEVHDSGGGSVSTTTLPRQLGTSTTVPLAAPGNSTPGPTSSPPAPLPRTGTGLAGPVRWGSGLLALGSVLMVCVHRRARHLGAPYGLH